MAILDTLINYGKQPSTWRGLVTIATAAGLALSPQLWDAISLFAISAFGLIEVIKNESKAKPVVPVAPKE